MFTDLLFVEQNGELILPGQNFLILYLVILLLSALVYKLGFARKLPLLKSVLVYVFLLIGALPLAFLGIALPFVEGLILTVIFLTIVRLRMRYTNSKEV